MGKRLWGYSGDEPFLGEKLAGTKGKPVELWFAKFVYEDRAGLHVALENPPYLAFTDIPPSKILNTQDVARACGCSARTVVRHVALGGLKVYRRVGNEFLFRKKDAADWLKTTEIKRGRPAKNVIRPKHT